MDLNNKIQYKNKQQTKCRKIADQIFFILLTLGKIVFQYADVVSDFVVLFFFIDMFKINMHTELKQFYLVMTMNVAGGLMVDRGFSFVFLVQLEKQRQFERKSQNQKENNNNSQENVVTKITDIKLSKLQYLKFFLIIFTLSDYIYIMLVFSDSNKKVFENMIKKSLVELVCENYLLLLSSVLMTFLKLMQGQKLQWLDYVALITSLSSCTHTVFTVFKLRYKEQPFQKLKKNIKYQELTIATQRYIGSPFILSFFKQISAEKYNYQEISVLNPHLQRNQQLVNQIESKQKPINKFKQLLLIFIILNDIICNIIIFVFTMYLDTMFGSYVRFSSGFLFQLPYIIKYLKTFTKQNQRKYIQQQIYEGKPYENYTLTGQIWKVALSFPYLYFLGAFQLRFSMGNQIFPLMSEVKENWVQNYIPSFYVVLTRTVYQLYDYLLVYYLLDTKTQNIIFQSFMLYDQDLIDENLGQDSFLWQGTKIAFTLQCVQLLYIGLNIIYYSSSDQKNIIVNSGQLQKEYEVIQIGGNKQSIMKNDKQNQLNKNFQSIITIKKVRFNSKVIDIEDLDSTNIIASPTEEEHAVVSDEYLFQYNLKPTSFEKFPDKEEVQKKKNSK